MSGSLLAHDTFTHQAAYTTGQKKVYTLNFPIETLLDWRYENNYNSRCEGENTIKLAKCIIKRLNFNDLQKLFSYV